MILSNSSQSVKKLLTPHADLLIVARLDCEFVECKHHNTSSSWLNYSHCGWMPHQITNLIWNTPQRSLVRARTSHGCGTLCTCRLDFSTLQRLIIWMSSAVLQLFAFGAVVFAWPAKWFFVVQHDFLIPFRGFKYIAADLCGVGTVQLVIPHLTYNDSRIFLHCEYPQTIFQSDSTHILPHLLRSGPWCEYFTCHSVGQFIYFSYSEHFGAHLWSGLLEE